MRRYASSDDDKLLRFRDDRLAKNAIEQLADSRMPEGITQSRYPSRMSQVIPTFSLAWIGMIHDHWMMHGDLSVAEKHLWGMREVLAWFGNTAWITDCLAECSGEFRGLVVAGRSRPAAGVEGTSIISLQYVIAMRQGSGLEEGLGHPRRPRHTEKQRMKSPRLL